MPRWVVHAIRASGPARRSRERDVAGITEMEENVVINNANHAPDFSWVAFYKELAEKLLGYENKQVDLIITDFRMHQMNGMQFVQALKNSDNVLTHAIIVVTVLKDQATHQELIAAGTSACLTKPVQTQELARIAKTLLEQSKLYYGLGLIK